MRKKSHRYKKSAKRNRSHLSNLRRYFLLLFVCIISFIGATLVIRADQTQPTCANSQSCKSDLTQKIENNVVGMFQGKKVIPPKITAMSESLKSTVLGSNTIGGEKHIYVDLSTETLYAYQGTTQVLKTPISSGKWNRTPVGNFHIWEKLLATRMSGGQGQDAYDLPNVPYVMYFYNDFGLHGTYWHDNFGYAMSHGCVNLRSVDAKILYDWVDSPNGDTPGTAVSICDKITPSNECIQNNPVQ